MADFIGFRTLFRVGHSLLFLLPAEETGSGLQVFHYELSIKRERIEFDSDNREVISISQGERT